MLLNVYFWKKFLMVSKYIYKILSFKETYWSHIFFCILISWGFSFDVWRIKHREKSWFPGFNRSPWFNRFYLLMNKVSNNYLRKVFLTPLNQKFSSIGDGNGSWGKAVTSPIRVLYEQAFLLSRTVLIFQNTLLKNNSLIGLIDHIGNNYLHSVEIKRYIGKVDRWRQLRASEINRTNWTGPNPLKKRPLLETDDEKNRYQTAYNQLLCSVL